MKTVSEVKAVNVKADWEVKHDQKLDQAAHVLSDEIWPIKAKLDRAFLMLQYLTDGYFRKYHQDNTNDHQWITYEFSKNETIAEIIDDYVYQTKEALGELEARAKRAREVNESA
ncbi:MAG: hypothetical protein AB7E31_16425 [Desulfitobacterium sp.]